VFHVPSYADQLVTQIDRSKPVSQGFDIACHLDEFRVDSKVIELFFAKTPGEEPLWLEVCLVSARMRLSLNLNGRRWGLESFLHALPESGIP
jgi:hypothetical protein